MQEVQVLTDAPRASRSTSSPRPARTSSTAAGTSSTGTNLLGANILQNNSGGIIGGPMNLTKIKGTHGIKVGCIA